MQPEGALAVADEIGLVSDGTRTLRTHDEREIRNSQVELLPQRFAE
jgi:hypothetical protein